MTARARLDLSRYAGATPGPWHRNIKPASKYSVVFAGRSTHVLQIIAQYKDDAATEANCELAKDAPTLLAALRDAYAREDALQNGVVMYLVPADNHEGLQLYERHEGQPPPLSDFEGPFYRKLTAEEIIEQARKTVAPIVRREREGETLPAPGMVFDSLARPLCPGCTQFADTCEHDDGCEEATP